MRVKIRAEDVKGRMKQEFILQAGVNTLGRAGDFVLGKKGLSRRHAQIEVSVAGAILSDLDSKNGTFVNGIRICEPTSLRDGDQIRLGEITFTVDMDIPAVSEALMMPSTLSRTDTETRGDADGYPTPPKMQLVTVRSADVDAIGRTWCLDGRTLEIGRGAGTATRFRDPRMSRKHLRFAQSQGCSYWVDDLGSANGTFVDGDLLLEPREVKSQQVIRAGDTVFVADTPPTDDLPFRLDVGGTEVNELIGVSLSSQIVRKAIETVAKTDSPVLLLGPTGAGKEVAANAIHRLSGRRGLLVPVNCAAVASTLAEDEFFGHYKNAFTGADEARDGYFVQSAGGTLFLDEIGDLPFALQAKLLRVLQDGVVKPLGNGPSVSVDLRIVAATNIELETSGFRSDLLARLAGWTVRIPPLRERKVDVLMLFEHFVGQLSNSIALRTADFDEGLLLYDWPQNVRELQQLARRLRVLARDEISYFGAGLLPKGRRSFFADREEKRGVAGIDSPSRERLLRALRGAQGNVKLVAERNGWNRTQVYRWMKRLGIDPKNFR